MDAMSLQAEIANYQANPHIDHRNFLIEEALPIVHKVARQSRNLYGYHLDFDDVVSIGIIALVECIEDYDSHKGMSFEAYAYTKIRFRLIDELGSLGFVPRRVRQEAKKVQEAYSQLAHSLMREPSHVELAKHLDMDANDLSHLLQDNSGFQLMSFEAMQESYGDKDLVDHNAVDPELAFLKKVNLELLTEALKQLPERDQQLISLYYYENLRLKEIGQIFDVSEARVSQMHAGILKKLKALLED